jgi:hypothetical protein
VLWLCGTSNPPIPLCAERPKPDAYENTGDGYPFAAKQAPGIKSGAAVA